MNKRIAQILTATALSAVVLIAGCSGEADGDSGNIIAEVVDSVAASVAFNVVQATRMAGETQPASLDGSGQDLFHRMSDMIFVGSKLYVTYDGGVIVYDTETNRMNDIRIGQHFEAVVQFNDVVYAGGEQLYTVGDSSLSVVDLEINGSVTELVVFDNHLLVGTDRGLYSNSILGTELMLDDVTVSALVRDRSGVWVGTDGQGLYRWDGSEFHKRYLRRDPALFDCVNVIDFNHGHLYVGTDDALYIHDGGKWKTLTSADGLPSNRITDIDASNWVVYVATDEGVVSYFENDFIPIKKVDTIRSSSIVVRDRKIYLGTASDGLLLKTGPVLRTLVEPEGSIVEEVSTIEPVAASL